MIGKYLVLDEKQRAKLEAWVKTLPPYRGDETATSEGREFVFYCYSTGIGDVLGVRAWVDGNWVKCNLAYDDDGELDYNGELNQS